MKMLFLILLFLVVKITVAQPGPDDAGLLIYDIQYIDQVTSLQNDSSFSYKQYLLNRKGDKVIEEITGFNKKLFSLHPQSRPYIYLPPFDANTKSTEKAKQYPNQRLDLIYRGDTMRIDFIGITTEMSSVYTPVMNRIVFCPGYFKLYLNFENEKPELFKGETNEVQKLKRDYFIAYDKINFITDGLLVANGLLEVERDTHRLDEMRKRDNRESCSEKNVVGNYYMLCADNILENDKVVDVTTKQSPKINNGQSVYYFYYYYSFDRPLVTEPISINIGDQKKEKLNYHGFYAEKSEYQIALEKYESLQKVKVTINGALFSGQLKFIEGNYPWFDRGSYTGTGWKVRVLSYKNGVLIKDEVIKEIEPTDN